MARRGDRVSPRRPGRAEPDLNYRHPTCNQAVCRFRPEARIISRFPGDASPAATPSSAEMSKGFEMPTYSPKASEITRAWHVIDADGLVLGRMCTEAARVLRGKHKPIFAPHIDTGDHVVIINASKVVLTKDKAANKGVYRYSGYPGGLKTEIVREAARPQAGRGHPPQHPRHAAEGPARPPDDQEAQGLRRPRASARRPAPRRPRISPRPRPAERGKEPVPWQPSRSPRPPVAARKPSLAPACAPAPARTRSTARRSTPTSPRRCSGWSVTEALRVTETEETYDIDATMHGGGISGQAGALRMAIARSLVELDPEARACAEEGRLAHPRPASQGEQEVRPQEGPQGPAVHQALIEARPWASFASAPMGCAAWR